MTELMNERSDLAFVIDRQAGSISLARREDGIQLRSHSDSGNSRAKVRLGISQEWHDDEIRGRRLSVKAIEPREVGMLRYDSSQPCVCRIVKLLMCSKEILGLAVDYKRTQGGEEVTHRAGKLLHLLFGKTTLAQQASRRIERHAFL